MMNRVSGSDVTVEDDMGRLLDAARGGSSEAWERFVALVYRDLRRMAHHRLGVRPREQTLDTTGLVHECYLRLVRGEQAPGDRRHFFALAAKVMRQVIVDYARERLAYKRGAGRATVPLERVDEAALAQAREFAELDDALRELERVHERQARVVECRFFAGLTEQETAEAVGVSLRLVQRDWSEARAWLEAFLRG
jgi:RNA polymerase sigma factor (TIGR02999 family)